MQIWIKALFCNNLAFELSISGPYLPQDKKALPIESVNFGGWKSVLHDR